MHPLRIAAGLTIPLYFTIGVIPAILSRNEYNAPCFIGLYAFVCAIALYTFAPYDIACASLLILGLWFLLNGRFWPCLITMIVTGLVRESSLHIIFFVGLAALLTPGRWLEKILWIAAFALVYAVEYVAVRHFFPAPISSNIWTLETIRDIFLGPGVLSLTSLFSVGLAVLIPLAVLLEIPADGGWKARFFRINAYAFVFWILFYRVFNGNLSEFRLFLPALVPLIFGLSQRSFAADETIETIFPWSFAPAHSSSGEARARN